MARENPGDVQTGPDSDRNRDDDPLRERHGTDQPDSASDMGVGTNDDDDEFEDDEDTDEEAEEGDVDES